MKHPSVSAAGAARAVLFLVFQLSLLTPTHQQCDLTVDKVLLHLSALDRIGSQNGGNRAAGTAGYQASVDYVSQTLMENTDYSVDVQEFTFTSFQIIGTPQFTQSSPVSKQYLYPSEFRVFSSSGTGNLQGTVTLVPNQGCTAADYASFPSGEVALIERGTCTFTEKTDLAKAHGAVAVIIFNNNNGPVFSGTADTTLPAYGVSAATAVNFLTGENVLVNINVQTEKKQTVTYNVIAETQLGDPNNVVLLGSHLDSVPAGPGINDNGSGTATNLATALELYNCLPRPTNKVRFAWWGGEELGLLGSTYYVQNLRNTNPGELNKIALNINIDMLGSPNAFFGIYNGSGAAPIIREKCIFIESRLVDRVKSLNKPYGLTPFDGRSDYGPFIEIGIPAGGLFSGAEVEKNATGRSIFGGLANTAYDPCYHDYCDSYDNIDPEALAVLSYSAFSVVEEFARSLPIIKYLKSNRALTDYNTTYFYDQHPDAISRY